MTRIWRSTGTHLAHTRQPCAKNDGNTNVSLGVRSPREAFQAFPLQVRWEAKYLKIAEVQSCINLRWIRQNSIDLFLAIHEFHGLDHARLEPIPFIGKDGSILSATDPTVFE